MKKMVTILLSIVLLFSLGGNTIAVAADDNSVENDLVDSKIVPVTVDDEIRYLDISEDTVIGSVDYPVTINPNDTLENSQLQASVAYGTATLRIHYTAYDGLYFSVTINRIYPYLIKSLDGWVNFDYNYPNGGGGGAGIPIYTWTLIPLTQLTAVTYSGLMLDSGTSVSASTSGTFEVIQGYGTFSATVPLTYVP